MSVCVSQPPSVSVTNRTPDSTSRVASRQLMPNGVFAERLGERGRFLADVEGLAGPLAGDDRVGLLAEAVEAGQELAVRLDGGERLVEIGQQVLPPLDLFDRQAVAQRDAADAERLARRGACWSC